MAETNHEILSTDDIELANSKSVRASITEGRSRSLSTTERLRGHSKEDANADDDIGEDLTQVSLLH